jgi:hypothetical protein
MNEELRKLWEQTYTVVSVELGMPPRGKVGCRANKERMRLAPLVFQETRRRYEKALAILQVRRG